VQDDHPRLAVDADLPENRLVEASPMITVALEQVLYNVAEHVDDPEPRARISLTDADDRSVRLSIADNGPGIDEPEMVHNTIEPVSQLRHSRGLGLWLVTWIVEKSNGELRIETPAAGSLADGRPPRRRPPPIVPVDAVATEPADALHRRSATSTPG